MSYIPPLVCDTPPPIDFEDSNEDDFGDGIFSNYDGSSLPTTPKLSSSINDHDDFPIDIPELPDLPQFPNVTESEFTNDYQDLNDSIEFTDVPPSNVSIPESNYICHNKVSPQLCEEKNEKDVEVGVEAILQTDLSSNVQIKDLSKMQTKLQSLENSSSSHSNSNDNVCRSESPESGVSPESPPSLVFSAESLNCDDNQSEDFEEFHQNNDDVECNDVECNFPSLKLDSISDTKSQTSDLEETNNPPDCEISEIKDNCETRSSNSNFEAKFIETVDSQSSNVECHSTVTNPDDSFDDFVEYANVSEETHQKMNDFTEYQEVVVQKLQQDFTQNKESKFSDDNSFAADFSQFEAFSEKEAHEPVLSNINQQHGTDEVVLGRLEGKSSTLEGDDDVEDVDDDEFGEFSDFNDFSQSQTSSIPSITTNVEELSGKIKPLLDNLFPSIDSECDDSNYDALDLTNDTTRIIKDFENSKALDHQWISSVGKSSLVTALGIDSRNILYGGKWNSSMPRFAANLGFSPLEPLKPSNVSGTTSTNSSVSNEVPAAQFDWNSSGLVNPLDASHAHTLLLDLEQLVVVANLDKIKLDSSTCSSTIPATSNATTNNNSMSSLNNHYIHNCNADGVGYQYNNGDFYGNSLPYSCETNIKTLDKNTNNFGLFDQFLDIRVQEILHKTNSAENQSSRAELDWHSTKAEPPLIAQTAPLSNIHTTLNINTKAFHVNEEPTQTSASYVVPGSGTLKETHIFTPSKSPYSIPQSRDVSNDKQESKCPDFDYEKAAAGIIIDENVVKKEYRDLEYDPDKPTTSALNDDFSDFQSVPMPLPPQIPQKPHQNILSMDFGILQPTKRSDNITINWPDPGNVIASTNLESFDSFTSVENVAENNKRGSLDFGIIGKSKSTSSTFGEFAKPVIGVSPSEVMFETNSNSLEDEFSDFQCVEPISAHSKFPGVISNYQLPPSQDITPSKPTEFQSSQISDKDSVSASEAISSNLNTWTNYQSPKETDITITTTVPPTNILQPAPLKPQPILTPQQVNPTSHRTNSIWPESEIDSDEIARLEAIFPQAQKHAQPTTSSSSLKTDYKTKSQNQNASITHEDDEWSDFVSVPTPASQPLPITNIISANIVKHQQDDDEWSDFVSSTSQPWNATSGPNFTSWNAPPQFDSWQSSTLFQQPQQFVPTIPATINNNPSLAAHPNTKTNPNSFFTQKAPSISLIPDLSFVAPKTLVNRSRTNYQSK